MKETKTSYAETTGAIIGAAIEVHRAIPISYKNVNLDCSYRADLIVGEVVVELKAVESILAVHEAQLLTYMKLLKKPVGLLINFNVPVLKDGIRRRVI